eukprot:TRINITY_DN65799_c0_g1_i1.p1 TRINITY_DN65799_c0_g1~~TRINITY_DN65799_c0_g1_i1.p1  ORF type:complete len:260 (-),score=69.25 TRINITY_DN65799_c0_g1_i1:35-814(-)
MSSYFGFLSGHTKTGRWVPEPEIQAKALAGGCTLDFSQALFTHPSITVQATSFWGSVLVIVPPNVRVEKDGSAILGHHVGSGGLYSSSTGSLEGSNSNCPVTVRVEGLAIMASVNAVVNQFAKPAELISQEEAQRILREVPEEPSTTFQDMQTQMRQHHDEQLANYLQTQMANLPANAPPEARAALQARMPAGYGGQPSAPPAGQVVAGVVEPAAVTGVVEPAAQTSADKILELKKLLDAGAITQEEFDNKKTELLKLM